MEREPRDGAERRAGLERAGEGDHRLFGFLADDRVDFGEVGEDFFGGERAEVAADRDVTAVAALAERDRERQEIARAPLEGERDPDRDWRLGRLQNGAEHVAEVALEVERNELRPKARDRQRRRDVTKAEVFLDSGPTSATKDMRKEDTREAPRSSTRDAGRTTRGHTRAPRRSGRRARGRTRAASARGGTGRGARLP